MKQIPKYYNGPIERKTFAFSFKSVLRDWIDW